MAGSYFTKASFTFLTKLSENNDREWFDAHKQDYEDNVRTPALDFINDMEPDLKKISKHFDAIPKKMGGSLMRIYRDVRFGKDKRPYKTNVGIQFRHALGKDVHAPGFYLHIEPGECFVGVGIWRPDSTALQKIRTAIVEKEKKWISVINDKTFKKQFNRVGDTLTNPPRGFNKEHPMIDELKRKDHLGISPLTEATVTSARLKTQVVNKFNTGKPFMQFLCKSLELNF